MPVAPASSSTGLAGSASSGSSTGVLPRTVRVSVRGGCESVHAAALCKARAESSTRANIAVWNLDRLTEVPRPLKSGASAV